MDLGTSVIYTVLIEKLKYVKKPIESAEINEMIPILEFHYKFSTLSAKYEVEIKKKFHFVMELLATMGALFAFFEIFNNYSNVIYEWIFGKAQE